MKILAISGFKNAGKTTLMTKLIAALTAEGLKVATVKHDGHEFEADVEGTDTAKHLGAGAMGTAIFSENKYMIVNQVHTTEMELFTHFEYADLIMLEGFKYSDYPKIELVKVGEEPIGRNVLAFVSEVERDGFFHRDDVEGILNVIETYLQG